MKAYLYIFFIALMACSQSKTNSGENTDSSNTAVYEQSDDSVKDNTKEPLKKDSAVKPQLKGIAYIRENVSRINTSKLEKKHFEYLCDEITKVDYFYENGEIKKIAIDFGAIGDVYAREVYYYQNGKLIFIYEFVELLMPCGGCDQVKEYRSYIENNKVIRYLKDKDNDNCNDCIFNTSSKEYRLLKAKTAGDMKAIICS